MFQDNKWVPFSKFGDAAKSINSSFDPRTYNHRSFKSLIESLDIFEIKEDQHIPPRYYCKLKRSLIENGKERKNGEIVFFGGWYGFIEGNEGDYYFTKTNLQKDQQSVKLVKGMKVNFDVIREPNPNAAETEEKRGKAEHVQIITGSEYDNVINMKAQ